MSANAMQSRGARSSSSPTPQTNAADHWNDNVANGEDLFWDVMKNIVR
jgi:hypothetical protein